MKIIAWNCNMAFRKKAGFIVDKQPDIVVVSECEHPDKLKFNNGIPLPTHSFWYGSNSNKGLGVFSYSNYKFKLLPIHNPELKNILPLAVTGGKVDFILFAIWANNPQDKDGAYVTQIWKAIHYYEKLLTKPKIILTGDFNSNTYFDKPKREGNHSAVVVKLEAKNITSAYHQFYKQAQGKEKHPTWFLYRHKNKPYHLDYCFASDYFIKRLKNVEVGLHKDWAHLSDHVPVTVTFEV
jgi:exonuclease III